MELNEYRDATGQINGKNGFHEVPFNLGEKLMLVTSELAECIEAHRIGRHSDVETASKRYQELLDSTNLSLIPLDSDEYKEREKEIFKSTFKLHIKEGIEAEIADAFIRLFDIAYLMKIDLNTIVPLVLRNNSLREYKHGKKY